MKLHAVLIPYLLLFFILPLPCPAQSQEDTLTNVEQIANSEEYEVYAKSVQLIAYFLNDNDVDFSAMSRAMLNYSATGDTEDYPIEIFKGIPNAVKLHQLSINRSLKKKIVNRKFEYDRLSKADKKRVREAYHSVNPFVLSVAEMEAMIDRISNGN